MFFDQSPSGVLLFGDDGRIEAINATLGHWTGVDPDRLQGVMVDELLAPAARVFHHMVLMPMLKLKGQADEVTLILRHADGTERHVLTSAVRHARPEGAVNHCVFIRIDQRRKVEEELSRARRVSDDVPGAIFQLEVTRDGHLHFTHVGEGIQRLFGLAATALREDAALFFEAVHPEDRAALLGGLLHHTGRSSEVHVEFRTRRSEADPWSWNSVHATPRAFANGSTLWNGYIADVTVQRQLEDSLRENDKLRLTAMLAAGIAHDFNNLLGSINGLAELCLLEAPEGSRMARNLGRILQGGERAAGLVRQLLDYARQSAQQPQPLGLADLLERLRPLLAVNLPRGVALVIDAPEEVVVQADPAQMEQVLLNLVNNAGHAMRGREGEVRLALARVHADDATNPLGREAARLRVVDGGCGIPPEDLANVFQPFFTTKPVGEGTGLGLAAVHGIVTSHAGSVRVDSQPDRGTAVSIWLPARA